MSTDYKFKGWVGLDKDSVNGKLVEQEYEPKPWEETDVDIEITHCGVCGSDLHTLRSGWMPTIYPVVVGHEIVGKAVRVGKDVKHVKVGDRVGVGAQSDSCLKCDLCEHGNESYCADTVNTYSGKYANGGISYGGYADYSRVPSHFVIPLNDINLPSHIIAPMLCGGVTLYSPLSRHGCGKTAQTVGIIGVGGLGHFGVMWAKALGAKHVAGISRKADKKDDVLKMGADEYIATDDDKEWAKHHAGKFDLLVSTVSSPKVYILLFHPRILSVESVLTHSNRCHWQTTLAYSSHSVPWSKSEHQKMSYHQSMLSYSSRVENSQDLPSEALLRSLTC